MQNLKRLLFVKPYSYTLLALVSLFLISNQANAENPTYQIEVIVFENLNLKGWTEEYWPEQIDLPITEESTSLLTLNQKPLWIEKRDSELMDTVKRLNKKGYRVLFHQAWSQTSYANPQSPTVLIENNQEVGSILLGTIRLYKTRFAHIDVDLAFERRIPEKVLEAFNQNQKLLADELPTHWRFNLKESRKIKPGELHYIDHPLFGALIKIQKYEE